MGLAALLIVLFSTVTTTFLDVYSAGVSAANLSERLNEKTVAVLVCALGTVLAASVSMEQYENFLFFIGSVFAPLFSILFVDYWLFGRREIDPGRLLDLKNAVGIVNDNGIGIGHIDTVFNDCSCDQHRSLRTGTEASANTP